MHTCHLYKALQQECGSMHTLAKSSCLLCCHAAKGCLDYSKQGQTRGNAAKNNINRRRCSTAVSNSECASLRALTKQRKKCVAERLSIITTHSHVPKSWSTPNLKECFEHPSYLRAHDWLLLAGSLGLYALQCMLPALLKVTGWKPPCGNTWNSWRSSLPRSLEPLSFPT